MFGIFGKSKDGLSKEARRENEWRDDQFSDAQSVLAEGIRSSNASKMAKGVKLMEGLITRYPDFSKPYVRMIQFSLKAQKFNLAKDLCNVVENRLNDDPQVKEGLEGWRRLMENHK